MRRLLVPILAVITLVVVAAGGWAADRAAGQEIGPDTLIINEPLQDWLEEEIKVTDLVPVPRGPDAGPAADQCSEATPLHLSFANTADGGGTVTNLFTQQPGDPVLGCMFGAPVSQQGFRTAWYSLTAGDTSIVTITTEGTEYDTVLAVYAGSCESPTLLACSDDFRGFQSSVSLRVVRGQTYLIEVADYKPGAPQATTLRLSAIMSEGGANWFQLGNLPFGGVSRHAFASNGPDMYIIGGQTMINGQPAPVITRNFYRYSAVHNRFDELAGVLGSSVSNTTAVYMAGRIYVPGGFNGDTSDYVNVHLAYIVEEDRWVQIAPIPTGLLPGGEMFAWSAAAAAPDQASYYVTGGLTSYPAFDPDGVVIPNVYRYTPASGQWSAVQPMTNARYAHTSAWVTKANRGLCVVGGLTPGQDSGNEAVVVLLTGGECFNPATGIWQPTGNLTFPRYAAGSAIGPDGNWYVFGGLDAAGGVPETEVYDPNTNTWHVLGGEFSLGGSPNNPARVWPRGAFWGNTLYVFGGNTPPPENRVISSFDRMTLDAASLPLVNRIMLPLSTKSSASSFLANGTQLHLNIPVSGNFVESTQFFNAYYFDWPALGRAVLRLTNVSDQSDLRIYIYNIHKALIAEEVDPQTGNATVSASLAPGRYFVVVERVTPGDLPDPNQIYQLVLQRH